MKQIFINPTSSIIRSGWRILIFLILLIAISYGFTYLVKTTLDLSTKGLLGDFIHGISATIAIIIVRKYLEKESIASMGLKFNRLTALDLIIGITIGALIMTGMYFTLLSLGLIKFEGFSWWSNNIGENANISLAGLEILLGLLLQDVIIGWWEEITFRGFFLQNISKGLSLKWAIAITTIIFGVLHALNPNASILSTCLIIITALLLVYAYLKTGQLWLSIGLHIGWNFFQSTIYGFGGSGIRFHSMITQSPVGSDWLNGGRFGAENSIFILLFMCLAAWGIKLWVSKTRKTKDDGFFKFQITNEDFNLKSQA